jgi:acyl-CoA synthetase (AMP-forming)/AMP-acid ligase II
MNLRDIIFRNAQLYPDKDAIVFEDRRLTFRDYTSRACRLGNALLASGLKHQDRVAILAPNCPEYLEAFAACESAGLIVVNINYRLSAKELIDICADCEPKALIFHQQYAELAGELLKAASGIETVIGIQTTMHGARGYEDVLAAAPNTPPPVAIDDEDIAYLIYTSGTTGRPKGVMLSHRAIAESARSISHDGGAMTSDVMLIVMPLFHIGGRIEMLGFNILGATTVLHSAFDASEILRSFEEHNVTAAHLAPIMVQRLLESPDLQTYRRDRLRCIHYASAPMPAPVLRRAIAAFGPILTQIYGLTECIVVSLLTPAQHILDGDEKVVRRLSSAGQPFLGCTVRIVTTDGHDAEPGEIGEILVRSPGLMTGYWNNHTATVPTLRGGWMHTGDLGYADDDRFIFIVDRKKDMIISGGENIYSWEVEEALRSHPDVAEAAVIGVPDDEWGESVKAFVVVRPGAKPLAEALIAHCRSRIASYKKPRTVEFVEALPRLFNGKIDKKALRAPYWSARNRQVA